MVNRLSKEKSPYLRLHMDNPVDWYPWGEEAFKKAREEDKPIFLSIGYYTCHWCHVMNRESFMDEEVAKELNKTFICIKVDREERPDIDSIYMKYAMSIMGGGGWPLTVLLTPDKKPFFVATYLPKETLIELARRVRNLWINDREKILKYADEVVKTLLGTSLFSVGNEYKEITENPIHELYKRLSITYDEFNGGFGEPPKFPSPQKILFLFRYWKSMDDSLALEMSLKTLDAMRMGGIYDQVGGGFHRYSTDAIWKLPHFEKMLYDQAWMIRTYAEAYQITGDYLYRETVEQTIEFLYRELYDGKLFYSALDAESEGMEGRYYIWSIEEIRNILGDEAKIAIEAFNLKEEGNYFDEATGKRTGYNIIYPRVRWEISAKNQGYNFEEYREVMDGILKKLFHARSTREKPNVDEKILCDWNAMTIASIAYASRILDDKDLMTKVETSLEEHLKRFYSDTLYHLYIEGERRVPALLDDYSYTLHMLVESYMTLYKPEYIERAIEMADEMLEKFYIDRINILLHTPKDTTDLPHHNLDLYDGPYPNGLSIAIHELIRLSRLTGEERFESIARELLKTALPNIERALEASPTLILDMLYILDGGSEVVVVPGKDLDLGREFISKLSKIYNPFSIYHLKHGGTDKISSYIKYYDAIEGRPTIYICRNFRCLAPTTDLKEAIKHLHGRD